MKADEIVGGQLIRVNVAENPLVEPEYRSLRVIATRLVFTEDSEPGIEMYLFDEAAFEPYNFIVTCDCEVTLGV